MSVLLLHLLARFTHNMESKGILPMVYSLPRDTIYISIHKKSTERISRSIFCLWEKYAWGTSQFRDNSKSFWSLNGKILSKNLPLSTVSVSQMPQVISHSETLLYDSLSRDTHCHQAYCPRQVFIEYEVYTFCVIFSLRTFTYFKNMYSCVNWLRKSVYLNAYCKELYIFLVFLSLQIQWVPQLFERLDFFHINKSCKIERCGNKIHQIVQNMILSRGLELKLSLLGRTTISGQHPLL